ncbi:hypothetical protein UFOVP244_69 [uncultured Caudovirales phage]|uniref:Uncharacterized protein n=1 Tax=uncultured Caudovirales phage TaxID=2100421 RepID=A0A6J7WWC9_9CAUD|nr:hypothetical protein UFOVP244_69 [uncultured Caudovirales phage]
MILEELKQRKTAAKALQDECRQYLVIKHVEACIESLSKDPLLPYFCYDEEAANQLENLGLKVDRYGWLRSFVFGRQIRWRISVPG